MATWQEVKNYINSNYQVEPGEGGMLKLLFNTGSGRSQFVFVGHMDIDPPLLIFTSPIGDLNKMNINRLVDATSDSPFGIRAFGDWVGLWHVQLLDTVDPAEIDVPLGLVTLFADQLEERFGDGDRL